MQVLVDTPVWSLAFRKKSSNHQDDIIVQKLSALIDTGKAILIGSIRQELLSGIRDESTFETLRVIMSAFPDTTILTSDYERAAQFFNQCRANGIQGSHTDFLMASVCHRLKISLFTLDQDFKHYSKYIPLHLMKIT